MTKPEYWHVYPIDDAEEHDIESQENCWCNPKLERQKNGNFVVTHNSLDGRERKGDAYDKIVN